ncbi:MAG: FecR domain-containing protein [Planctomycetota bacterium]
MEQNNDVELLISGYFDGKLSPEQLQSLERILSDDSRARDEFIAFARQHRLLNVLFDDSDESFIDKTLAAIRSPKGSDRFMRSVMKKLPRHPRTQKTRHRKMTIVPFAAAAAAVLFIAAYIATRPSVVHPVVQERVEPVQPVPVESKTHIATVSSIGNANVSVIRGGVALPVGVAGVSLDNDDFIECASGASQPAAKIKYEDGTEAVAYAGASLRIFSTADGKRLNLKSGRLDCTVTPQPSPMRIITDVSYFDVLGTQFRVDALDQAAYIGVQDGKVKLSRRSDGQFAFVQAGEGIYARPTGSLNKHIVRTVDPSGSVIARLVPSQGIERVLLDWAPVISPEIDEGLGQKWEIIDGVSYDSPVPLLAELGSENRAALFALKTELPKNYTIVGRYKMLTGGDSIGFYLRYEGPTRHYCFSISQEGQLRFYIDEDTDDDSVIETASIRAGDAGQWHSFKIVVNDTQYSMSIDGKHILECSDDRLANGSFAILSHRQSVVFDELIFISPIENKN